MGKFDEYIKKEYGAIDKTHVSTDNHIIPYKATETNHLDDAINAGEVANIQAIAKTVELPTGYTIQGWQYDWVGQRLGFMLICPTKECNFEQRFDIGHFIDRLTAELINQSKYRFIITGGQLTSESWVEGSCRQYYVKKLTTTASNNKINVINEMK